MRNSRENVLNIKAKFRVNGIRIFVEEKTFDIEYPNKIWGRTPAEIRQVLLENLTFANTHFLPLILNKEKINYQIPYPIFESFFFKNQLFDLLNCEKADKVKPLSYFRKFYNLEYTFESTKGTTPDLTHIPKFRKDPPIAIIPFTFGKESLLTFALCKELDIKPVLVYCQEPAHPHEESYKLEKAREFEKNFNVNIYYIKNEPGSFRYGLAFKKKIGTEIGWGAQTTILALLCLPFVFAYQAKYILLGNESSNDEWEFINKWKSYLSFDQTSFWTPQQSNMVRLLTNNQCSVKSSLEPLEEISNFYILHNRYPEIGKYQFSCGGKFPLYKDSQWCHKCYKCARMFLFARCLNIDPFKIGFKKDLLNESGLFEHYFGKKFESGSTKELDFAFYILSKKRIKSDYIKMFKEKKLKNLKPWKWYKKQFTKLKTGENLPEEYRNKMIRIFKRELENFNKILPK